MKSDMISNKFTIIFQKVLTMLIALIVILGLIIIFHFPSTNYQQVAVASFLSSTIFFEQSSQYENFSLLWRMYLGIISLEFIIGMTANYPIVQLIFFLVAVFFILRLIKNRNAAITVILIGYLNYYVTVDFTELINSSFELLISLSVGSLFGFVGQKILNLQKKQSNVQSFSLQETIHLCALLLLGSIIAELVNFHQRSWIVLTILFIYLAQNTANDLTIVAKQRIFSVPLGLWAGIIFLSNFTYLNYHFFYLIPLFGATGFFMLFYRGNFFLFSLFFMFSFMVIADYQTGYLHAFHSWQLLFYRSIATLIGAMLVIIFPDTRKEKNA